MSISKYEKDGKTYWRVYLNIRSRIDSRVRIQRRINEIESEKHAIACEKQLLRRITEDLSKEESRGMSWGEVVEKWVNYQFLYPSKRLSKKTQIDYEAIMRNWTATWWNTPAQELTRGDGRDLIRLAEVTNHSVGFCRRLKNVTNAIFTWGIEERFIRGVHQSPVYGLEIENEREEKKPEILTVVEIRLLLRYAKEQNHSWYTIWVAALMTGCRSGELHELKKSDLEMISRSNAIEEDKKPIHLRRYGLIRVRRAWDTRFKEVGPTKAGYWRTVPISSQFYWFLIHDLSIEDKPSNHSYIFPRHSAWRKGEQARILRAFCEGNRLPSIKFHTLRACFATQLIQIGIPATVVMKICGWRDLKTMQRYIRLAGIDEAGATERLEFIPTEEAVMEKVVNLYDYQKPNT
jgi:integrase